MAIAQRRGAKPETKRRQTAEAFHEKPVARLRQSDKRDHCDEAMQNVVNLQRRVWRPGQHGLVSRVASRGVTGELVPGSRAAEQEIRKPLDSPPTR